MSDISVVSAVLCDEVRREVGDKATIVGARQSGPAFRKGEDNRLSRMGLYIELDTAYPPPNEIEVRLHDPDNEATILKHKFPIEQEPVEIPEDAEARGVLLIVINREDISIPSSGEYFLQYRTGGGPWSNSRSFVFPQLIEDDSEQA